MLLSPSNAALFLLNKQYSPQVFSRSSIYLVQCSTNMQRDITEQNVTLFTFMDLHSANYSSAPVKQLKQAVSFTTDSVNEC